jgi:hypothetical protein
VGGPLYDTAHSVFRPRHMSPEELKKDLPGFRWVVLAYIHLAAEARAVASRSSLSRDVVSLQTFEPVLALLDQARVGTRRLAAFGRLDPITACARPSEAGTRETAGVRHRNGQRMNAEEHGSRPKQYATLRIERTGRYRLRALQRYTTDVSC